MFESAIDGYGRASGSVLVRKLRMITRKSSSTEGKDLGSPDHCSPYFWAGTTVARLPLRMQNYRSGRVCAINQKQGICSLNQPIVTWHGTNVTLSLLLPLKGYVYVDVTTSTYT